MGKAARVVAMHRTRFATRNRRTDPPLNAPTGFRTGRGAATSANLRVDVWKLRVVRAAEGEERRIAGLSMRVAILCVISLLSFGSGRVRIEFEKNSVLCLIQLGCFEMVLY